MGLEETKTEIDELVKQIIGKVNNIDSRKDKADVAQKVLNDVVAGVDLSKLEKSGLMTNLLFTRVR